MDPVLLTVVSPTRILLRTPSVLFFSFSTRNSVLDWLATRPLDAIKFRTFLASSSKYVFMSSLVLLQTSVVVSSAKLVSLEWFSHSPTSAVYRVNTIGLKIPPCGTPDDSVSNRISFFVCVNPFSIVTSMDIFRIKGKDLFS